MGECRTGRLDGEVNDWRTQYLEANQRSAHFQEEYATAANRAAELERKLCEAETRPHLPLVPLQIEALQLARDLQGFLKEMGEKPDIGSDKFPKSGNGVVEHLRTRAVLQEPWLTKFESLYRARYGQRLQSIVNEFGARGFKDNFLDACARAGMRDDDAQRLIESLVSAAFQLDGIFVFPRNVYSVREMEMMSEDERGRKIAEEPGFGTSYQEYLRAQMRKEKKPHEEWIP
jgi:hypothetical protein